MKRVLAAIIVIVATVLLILSSMQLLLPYLDRQSQKNQIDQLGFHFGVSFCGNTTAQAKLLIDRVKGYTNLFVVQSGPVSINETSMNEIIDYAVASGLDVIVSFGYFNPQYPWQIPWLDYAKTQWGSHLLGIYLYDEPGGNVLDANWIGYFNQLRIHNISEYYLHAPAIDLSMNGSLPVDNYQAAYHFEAFIQNGLGLNELRNRSIASFTSDYGLYWFDYLGGYGTIFAEFGSNQSTTQAIALARGAARLQNKTWGDIITWKYNQAPYIENSTAMYNDLMSGYMAGANYEIIFDYPQVGDNPYGILTDQHFTAMQTFWNNIQTLKPNSAAEAALILPHDYGWGMRSPQDSIWGIWKPDNTSAQIWNVSRRLLSEYGLKLDIVYDDQQFPVVGKYSHIYFWNQTVD